MKEQIYVWLSLIEELDYLIYLKLIEIFGSTSNLYTYSKDKLKFQEYLKSNNLNLDENLKSKLFNNEIKEKSIYIYKYLKSKNIKIIPINSKYYIKKLKNIFSPPLCIYVSGDTEKLNDKKIFLYENNNITKYAKKIIYLIKEKILNVNNYLILNNNFNIHSINLISDLDKIVNNTNEVNVYYNNSYKKRDIRNLEIISGCLDLLIIPEADYTEDICIIVDSFLELGKNIVIFPNEIFNKNAYFSNYLIKNGANMLTNIYQIEEIISEL